MADQRVLPEHLTDMYGERLIEQREGEPDHFIVIVEFKFEEEDLADAEWEAVYLHLIAFDEAAFTDMLSEMICCLLKWKSELI